MGDYEPKSKQPTKSRATAGASEDDRFGPGPVAKHLEATVLAIDVVNGGTLVTLSKGKWHDVRQSQEGYIKGLYAKLIVQHVDRETCKAFVDVTRDELRGFKYAVINPLTWPMAPTKPDPSTTRVIHVCIEDGRTRITIPRGTAHGIQRGTRGHLISDNGAVGDAFAIDLAKSRQAIAYIANTVDYVHAHMDVKLEQSAPSSSPVQRRASGASASSDDVQATAQAGVASASSQLPFLDIVQRSFGKHDISNIRSQIGGPAAAASGTLGASAYATGDKVAFASAPDLHTAAHEAAHVIQQRRGAVGFQGLGAAHDEHERHADAVADAVVAGQSAEPLLDKVVGASPTFAIQRKPRTEVTQRGSEEHGIRLDSSGRDSQPTHQEIALLTNQLDLLYADIVTSHNGIINRQQIAVREVLGNLNEADSPPVADTILAALATVALGYASGGIAAWVAGKLTSKEQDVLNTAIQTALDDGFKSVIPGIVGRLSSGGASSKATFFASQEEALETCRELGDGVINKKLAEAKAAIIKAPSHDRIIVYAKQVSDALSVGLQRDLAKTSARQIQYQASLSAWMTALAQGELGKDALGTKLDDAMDISPKNHFNKRGESGIIYVAFGQRPARRPISANSVKVVGMTEAARQRIKNVPIVQLAMPIVATGYLYNGALDALSISMLDDNELSLGRNEAGSISVRGHEDAVDALKKATGTTNELQAARIILEEDIGKETLADAKVT